MKCLNSRNGMKRKDNNKFYPFIFGISGFIYLTVSGIFNHFVNSENNPWVNLAFVVPMILFSVFTMYMCVIKIKEVKPSDIYLPPIVFAVAFLICSYGFTLICPDMFLRQAYLSLSLLYGTTAVCIAIITVIPKIPRKRFVILSYLGVLILAFFGIAGAVYNCFSEVVEIGEILEILLIIREGIIN